jgi:hypothetical protein
MAAAEQVQQLLAGSRALPDLRGVLELEVEGHRVNTRVTLGSADDLKVEIPYQQNDPRAWRSTLQQMQRVTRDEATGDFKGRFLLWPPRADAASVKAGWLRAGYLVAFAALGYRYILDAALEPVRQQIGNPAVDNVGLGVSPQNKDADTYSTTSSNGVIEHQLVVLPEAPWGRSLLVRLAGHKVLLPLAEHDRAFYERLNRYAEASGRADLKGYILLWPTEPHFAFDYHPPGRALPR